MMKLEEYLALPYTMIVRWSADDELYVARVQEIPGCTGHGTNEADALAMLRDNLSEWISYCMELGEDIPVPSETDQLPSGKWLQRVPRSLHKRLIECAEADNVSLNLYVTTCLARAVGHSEVSPTEQRVSIAGSADVHAGSLVNYICLEHAGAWSKISDHPWAAANVYNSFCKTEFVQGGEIGSTLFAPIDEPEYAVFVNKVADQLPTHSIKKSARTSREEKENYKKFAYA